MTEREYNEIMHAYSRVPFEEEPAKLTVNTVPLNGLDIEFMSMLLGIGASRNTDDLFAMLRGLDYDKDAEMIEQYIQFFGRRLAGITALEREVFHHGLRHLSEERLLLLYYCKAAFGLWHAEMTCQWKLSSDEEHRPANLAALERTGAQLHIFDVRYLQMESCHAENTRY